MAETFLVLLTGHLIGDFVLQTRYILEHKKNPAVLSLHVGLVTLSSAALLGAWHGPILGIIFITHLLMDAVKVYLLPSTASTFLFDQAVHVLVMIGVTLVYPMAFHNGAWPALLSEAQLAEFLRLVTLGSGLVAGIRVGGIFIDIATQSLVDQLSDSPELTRGLKHGGRYIGWLERALIMLLYFIGEPSGIGLLLTAKSILRFGEIKNSSHRKLTEYIIIGTLMSFGWALLAAVLTAQTMPLWRR